MGRRLEQVEHGLDAVVVAVEQVDPLVTVAGGDDVGHPGPQARPVGAVVDVTRAPPAGRRPPWPGRRAGTSAAGWRATRTARPAPVDGVAPVAPVDQVGLPLGGPRPALQVAVDVGHEVEGAVDDGGVDDLPLPRAGRLPQRRHHPEGEEGAAPAEVAGQDQRRDRRPVGFADGPQRTRERQVVDVETGPVGQRAGLAVAGHAAVDELRVAGQAGIGPESEPLGHAGPEALDEAVGPVDQAQYRLDALGVLRSARTERRLR